ncbi:MAG TPA: SUMF1/EgtB/PvdO family nonheme iron enzyme [Myxococcota bacterium]|nr:SUMF1/EgtB/PvdO family nonheme iron enzyme [Myxococcota bacterium]
MFKRALSLFAVLFVACAGNDNDHDNNNNEQLDDECLGVVCGMHAFCAVGPQGIVCVCEQGFTKQDGICQEASVNAPCEGVECGANGVCQVQEGKTTVCLCGPGYRSEGSKCVVREEPKWPCTGVECSGHGFCAVTTSNEAFCVCDEGFITRGTACVDPENCVPSCEGKECGSDGCGGFCASECVAGLCQENGLCPTLSANCSDGWCLIPAGTFEMGSFENEACRWDDEGPVHSVTISRPFYMKQTEVTQAEWKSLMGNNPSTYKAGGDYPVERVNWAEAVYYANKLSKSEGLDTCYTIERCHGTAGVDLSSCDIAFKGLDCEGYRLPTEAEWEYAARAGSTFTYGKERAYIGSDWNVICELADDVGIGLPEISWYDYNSGYRPHPVKQLKPNPWGLYDVYGNVQEWVHDRYDEDYYTACKEGCTDPLAPEKLGFRVYRGGCYAFEAKDLRVAKRDGADPNVRQSVVGFRLVRAAP